MALLGVFQQGRSSPGKKVASSFILTSGAEARVVGGLIGTSEAVPSQEEFLRNIRPQQNLDPSLCSG